MVASRCTTLHNRKEAVELIIQDGYDFDNNFAESDSGILETNGEFVLVRDDFCERSQQLCAHVLR